MTTFGTLNKDGTISNEMKLDLNKLPSSDPLAFGYGIATAQRYVKNNNTEVDHGGNFKDLAPEYLRGFLYGYTGILVAEGTRIRKGKRGVCIFTIKIC